MIRKFFNGFVYCGIQKSDHYADKRSILISNYISLSLVAALLASYVIRLLFFQHVTSSHLTFCTIFIGIVAVLFPVLLNCFQLTTLSRILMCYIPVGYLWYAYVSGMKAATEIEVSMYDGLRLQMIALSITPYLIFGRRKRLMLIIGIIPSFVFIIFLDNIFDIFHLGISQVGIESMDYELMKLRTMVTYFLINGGSFVFHSIINHNDEFTEHASRELEKQSKKILDQNVELQQRQLELQEMNNKLEKLIDEKTKHLRLQNKVLKQYAFSNAHDVRGPLARLMGLMYLKDIDANLDPELLLDKIAFELNDLNNIVDSLTNSLNDHIVTDLL